MEDVKSNFTKVPNKLIKDTDVPDWALRLLLYMISKPNDWIFQPSAIGKELNVDSRLISRRLNRMKHLGLIEKVEKFKWKVVYR